MTRRVLLTGASGFVGRAAVPALLRRGFDVHTVGRRPPGADVAFHPADLMDRAAVAAVVRRVAASHLLHLAWDVTPGRYWTAPDNLDWVAASLHLYREFAARGGRRATIAGSCAEYDWSQSALEEDAAARPATLYGAAKLGLLQVLAAAAAQDGVGLGWGRLFFLYGPHEAAARLVPSVVVPLLRGAPALVGDGVAVRDFLHVADVAEALTTVLDSAAEGPVNIAGGRGAAIRDVVQEIGRQIGRPGLLRLGARPSPAGEPPVLAASGARLAGLGFRPKFTLQSGLADSIAWWRRRLA